MRVSLSLADPWEMGETLGWPTILGSVIHHSADAWLVEVLEPFTYADAEYRFIVVTARHAERPLAASEAQDVPCNMIRTTHERMSAGHPCDVSWWRGGGAMIGSIKAVGP